MSQLKHQINAQFVFPHKFTLEKKGLKKISGPRWVYELSYFIESIGKFFVLILAFKWMQKDENPIFGHKDYGQKKPTASRELKKKRIRSEKD